jgi:hypothetical protein
MLTPLMNCQSFASASARGVYTRTPATFTSVWSASSPATASVTARRASSSCARSAANARTVRVRDVGADRGRRGIDRRAARIDQRDARAFLREQPARRRADAPRAARDYGGAARHPPGMLALRRAEAGCRA